MIALIDRVGLGSLVSLSLFRHVLADDDLLVSTVSSSSIYPTFADVLLPSTYYQLDYIVIWVYFMPWDSYLCTE